MNVVVAIGARTSEFMTSTLYVTSKNPFASVLRSVNVFDPPKATSGFVVKLVPVGKK
jgi:hypothetical protein